MSILRVLREGEHRFSGLRSRIPGISANLLSTRLQELVSAGVLEKVLLPTPADCRVYRLTALGLASGPILDAVDRWSALLAAASE